MNDRDRLVNEVTVEVETNDFFVTVGGLLATLDQLTAKKVCGFEDVAVGLRERLWHHIPLLKAAMAMGLSDPEMFVRRWKQAMDEPMPFDQPPVGGGGRPVG